VFDSSKLANRNGIGVFETRDGKKLLGRVGLARKDIRLVSCLFMYGGEFNPLYTVQMHASPADSSSCHPPWMRQCVVTAALVGSPK
jgi:hypothetical protein